MANHLEFSQDPTGKWSRAVARGAAIRLAPGIYTTDLDAPLELQVRRDIWRIVSHALPDAVVTDRTARAPAWQADEPIVVFAAHPHRRRVIRLPGATIVARTGLGPQPEDPPFRDGTRIASEPRALLENARKSRASRDLPPSTLSRQELADWIAELVNARGAERMGRLRDQMRDVADRLDLQAEYRVVDGLIGAALGTRAVPAGASPAVHALHAGRGFDQTSLERFDDIAGQLAVAELPAFTAHSSVELPFAFFEAYFSNFIEGTEFAVEEAADICFRGVIPNERPEDAHDVLGTWRIVSDTEEMQRTPQDRAALVRLLRARHAAIMERRPDKRPGEFKLAENRAGSTVFVAPDLVDGTLDQGFDLCRSLETPFQRAVFAMFLVAEIHPFADGNGRTARIMMNAELVTAGEERIVVPTVYRSHYLSALKALSQNGRAEPLIRMLDFAQKWTAAIDWRTVEETRSELDACNAFLDPAVADEEGKRLRMPGRIGA